MLEGDSFSVVHDKTKNIKSKIRQLISQGRLEEAKDALAAYEKAMPNDLDLYPLIVEILMHEGSYDKALYMISQGLSEDPNRFELLHYRGLAYEKKKQFVTAWDGYRNAVIGVKSKQQEQKLKESINRVRNHIKSKAAFRDEGYVVAVDGNEKQLVLAYDMGKLLFQKTILNVLLNNLDLAAETVVEIESAEGVVTRALNLLGFQVKSFESDMKSLELACGIDLQERIRIDELVDIDYMRPLKLTETSVADINGADVILFLPKNLEWFKQYGVENAMNILKTLADKGKRQIFILLVAPDNKQDEEFHGKLKEALDDLAGKAADKRWLPVVSDSRSGGLLRLDMIGDVKSGNVIPSGMEGAKGRSKLLSMPLEKCVDVNLFSYDPKGWHPFVAVVKELLDEPELDYENSTLKKFYRNYRPKNRQQQWLYDEIQNLSPIGSGWPNLPWLVQTEAPLKIPKKFVSKLVLEREGNQHFGPNSDRFGREELKRIKSALDIMKRGYHPEIVPDGYINGYLLINGNDYRFVVTEGQHRLPALVALGYKEIRCKFDKNPMHPDIVDLDKSSSWYLVKKGLYPREVAEKLFLKFFEDDGTKKAKHFQLL